MSKFKSNIDHLKSSQLEEYIHGRMSDARMFEIEKHLLECNLCSDAVEGIEEFGADNFVATTARIKHWLPKKTTTGYFPFWVAAGVSIVLVAGIVAYLSEIEKKDSFISMNKESPKLEYFANEEAKTPAPTNEKKIEIMEEGVQMERQKSTKPRPEIAKTITRSTPNIIVANPVREEKQMEEQVLDQVAEMPVEDDQDIAMNLMTGGASNEVSATDFVKNDRSLPTSVLRQGIAEKRARTKAPTPQMSAERPAGTKNIFSASDAAVFIAMDNATPTVSIAEYSQYLREHIVEIGKESEGDVIVSFFVDKELNIVDFRIEKGLNSANDKEARRLIFEGPAWKLIQEQMPLKNNKVVLRITF